MLATMERPPITQPFQICQRVRGSPPLQSPRTASIAFPSPNSISSFGIPSPEHSNYSSLSTANNTSRCTSNNSCMSLPVHSPPGGSHYHQSDIMADPTMYPNSSMTAMIPPACSPSVDCYKHDPTCSPSPCNLTSAASLQESPPTAVTPGTPQQQQGQQINTIIVLLLLLLP